MIQNGNPYFQEHNVRCEPQLMTANARVLFPPAIKYHGNDRVEPERGSKEGGYGRIRRHMLLLNLKLHKLMNTSHHTYYQFGQNVHSGNVEKCAGGEQQNYASHVG